MSFIQWLAVYLLIKKQTLTKPVWYDDLNMICVSIPPQPHGPLWSRSYLMTESLGRHCSTHNKYNTRAPSHWSTMAGPCRYDIPYYLSELSRSLSSYVNMFMLSSVDASFSRSMHIHTHTHTHTHTRTHKSRSSIKKGESWRLLWGTSLETRPFKAFVEVALGLKRRRRGLGGGGDFRNR